MHTRTLWLLCALSWSVWSCQDTPTTTPTAYGNPPVERLEIPPDNWGLFQQQTATKAPFLYHEEEQNYTIAENLSEEVRFLSIPLSGDFILDVRIPSTQINNTFGLLVAADPNAETTLATLQVADEKVAFAPAARVNLSNALRVKATDLRLERIGNQLSAYYAAEGQAFRAIAKQQVDNKVYVGLFARATTQALTFHNLRLTVPATAKAFQQFPDSVTSRLELLNIKDGRRTIVFQQPTIFEAPNWLSETAFIVNSKGKLYTIYTDADDWQPIETKELTYATATHALMKDKEYLLVSDQQTDGMRIARVPVQGGTAETLSPKAPIKGYSFSPDGTELVYVTKRKVPYTNIYTYDLTTNKEHRRTQTFSFDQSPTYTANGSLYFSSTRGRSRRMKLWKLPKGQKRPTQLTSDKYHDWFPHPSPDGTKLVFISYNKSISGHQHPAAQKVLIRMLDLTKPDAAPVVLAHVFGGQGTLNAPSWSPDSQSIAFVSYSFE